MLSLRHDRIAPATADERGRLIVGFDSGRVIEAGPDASYENWEISGPGFQLIATPGVAWRCFGRRRATGRLSRRPRAGCSRLLTTGWPTASAAGASRTRRGFGSGSVRLEAVSFQDDELERVEALAGDDAWIGGLLERLPADRPAAVRARVLDERGYPKIRQSGDRGAVADLSVGGSQACRPRAGLDQLGGVVKISLATTRVSAGQLALRPRATASPCRKPSHITSNTRIAWRVFWVQSLERIC